MSHHAPAALQRPQTVPLKDKIAWSVSETAQACGLSDRFIHAAIAAGELTCIRMGRRVLLRPADVEAWLAKSAVRATPE